MEVGGTDGSSSINVSLEYYIHMAFSIVSRL